MDRDHIDIYCERVGPAFWAEPLNAATNLAFILSAALLARALVRDGHEATRGAAQWALVTLVFLIGIGSGLFHTLAVRWAMLADVIPITLFMLIYVYLAQRRFVQLGVGASLLGVTLFLALSAGIPALTGFRGGSYLAALLVMLGFGVVLRAGRRHRSGNALLIAGCVFAVSLGLRTVDAPLCASLPTGTHFLWHLLNAVVLYIVTRTMIRFAPAARA